MRSAPSTDELRSLSGEIAQDLGKLREVSRATREETSATVEMVGEVEKKLGSLADFQEMSRTTDERLATLNALAEHVTQKIKALDNQKHTVEHAVVESNRLNEMIWKMEVQITRLNEAAQQATRVEELIDRAEHLSQDVSGQLESGTTARDSFTKELAKLEQDRTSLIEFVRGYVERMAIERRSFEAFDQRVNALQASIASAEKEMEALSARDGLAASVGQRVEQLSGQMQALGAATEDLQRRQASLTGLEESLGRVDELAKKTSRQYNTLEKTRQDIDALRQELQEVHATHAAAAQLAERLTADRTALERFVERTTAFSAGLPELEARIDAITGKLAIIDEGARTATDLVAIAGDLDRQMASVISRQEFVERIEARLHTLSTLTSDVDRRMDEQIARRAEIETLASGIEGVSIRVAEARQGVESVSALQGTLLPLGGQVASLKQDVEQTRARLGEIGRDEADLAAQEQRLGGLLKGTREAADEAAAWLEQVEGLSGQVGQSTAVKDQLINELTLVQAQQRDVATGLEAADDQLKRLETLSKQLEQRRGELGFADTRIAAFEARLADLRVMTDTVDRKIQSITEREGVVEAIRKEVAGAHEISSRSKADLQHVEAHRSDIAALRERVDAVLASISETESRVQHIDARRKMVDEVALKTNLIVNVLEDVRLNMESLGEHKALMDHVLSSVHSLSETVQEAQSTMRALQAERALAERPRTARQGRSKPAADDKNLCRGGSRAAPTPWS